MNVRYGSAQWPNNTSPVVVSENSKGFKLTVFLPLDYGER
jgi:hypothetical protein